MFCRAKINLSTLKREACLMTEFDKVVEEGFDVMAHLFLYSKAVEYVVGDALIGSSSSTKL